MNCSTLNLQLLRYVPYSELPPPAKQEFERVTYFHPCRTREKLYQGLVHKVRLPLPVSLEEQYFQAHMHQAVYFTDFVNFVTPQPLDLHYQILGDKPSIIAAEEQNTFPTQVFMGLGPLSIIKFQPPMHGVLLGYLLTIPQEQEPEA